ncbi:MAG: 1,4-alpha-glucan branching protein GlgB, partial [Clostridia bacterium]|nr:1,4-alpha-glucan branching protein GlgB [Clostridia bacterium]
MKKRNDMASYLFHQGTNYTAYDYLGLHIEGSVAVFRVWAPNAEMVFVVGDFNEWKNHHPMTKITDAVFGSS